MDRPDRMSELDAMMWHVEKDPRLRSTITSISVLEAPPEPAHVRAVFDRAIGLLPRLTQRVVEVPGNLAPPTWETDPQFDLDFHLRSMRLPGEPSMRKLLDVAAPFTTSTFDPARPLWEMVLVEGLPGGRAALLQRLHHSLVDGVGAARMAARFFSSSANPPEGAVPAPPAARIAPRVGQSPALEQALLGLQHEAGRAWKAGRDAASLAARGLASPIRSLEGAQRGVRAALAAFGPATTPMSPAMRGRSLSVHFDYVRVPVADLRAAAKAQGARVNDAYLAALLGALASYHSRLDVDAPELRMMMPINVRTAEDRDASGNHIATARMVVPLTITDPRARIVAMRDAVAAQRIDPSLAMLGSLATVANRLPRSVSVGLFGAMSRGVDFVASNVSGASVPLHFAGQRIEESFGFGPLSGAAINFTLISYAGDAFIGIASDPWAVAEPDVLRRCVADALAELIAVR